jgi:hypothetical protein
MAGEGVSGLRIMWPVYGEDVHGVVVGFRARLQYRYAVWGWYVN